MRWFVYAKCARDAQIYSGNPDIEDIYEEANENKWLDFYGDALLDIVDASSYDEAIEIVAEEEWMDENALYAIEDNDQLNAVLKSLISEYTDKASENLDKSQYTDDFVKGYKEAFESVVEDLKGILRG